MNFYPHHIGDFNGATRHLTRVERSVYRDAIELYYDTEQPLNSNIEKLQRRLLCSTDEEKNALLTILEEFFSLSDDGYTNERCEVEIKKYRTNTSAKARAGIASAEKRKQNSTGVQQVLNGCLTNQEPITNNQEPITNEKSNPLVASDAVQPHCPHEKIIELYHKHLPMMPAVKVWTDKRKKSLQARWRESEKRQSLDYWERFFLHVAKSDFLCGRTEKPFTCNLEWLVNSANFVKILEGNYANK